jgi:DNA polymerase-4
MKQDSVFFHIDVNSAFLSWEAARRLREDPYAIDIREVPCAVGGDESKRHGIILAKSIPAKKYGIITGESINEALRKYPELQIIPPDYRLYCECSDAFMNILKDYSPDIEKFSIDEAFVDVSGTRRLFGEPLQLAHTIKDRIRDELGFTVNIGISDVKFLAKIASDFTKPDRVHTLYKAEIKDKMWPLPVSDLLYVGKSTKSVLSRLGIKTIGELANTDISILRSNLKSHGEFIWNMANGEETSIIDRDTPVNKGYSNSTTIEFDITDASSARMVLLSLCENVTRRLRQNGEKCQMVSVEIKDYNLHVVSHQKMLENATNITREVYEASVELFDELWDGIPIRLLGVRVSKLNDNDLRQLTLFDNTDYEKLMAADKVMDDIRNKFGTSYIKRASFLDNNSKK